MSQRGPVPSFDTVCAAWTKWSKEFPCIVVNWLQQSEKVPLSTWNSSVCQFLQLACFGDVLWMPVGSWLSQEWVAALLDARVQCSPLSWSWKNCHESISKIPCKVSLLRLWLFMVFKKNPTKLLLKWSEMKMITGHSWDF